MHRLHNFSIQLKLYGIVIICTLGLSAVAGLAALTLGQYRINGPVYERIVSAKNLLAETVPSSLTIGEPMLVLYQIDEATDASEQRALRERFQKLEKEFHERHAYWEKHLDEGELRRELLVSSRRPADDFFHLVDREYLPAKSKGDAAAMRQLLSGPLRAKYDEHARAIDRVIALATRLTADEEAQAAASMSFWVRVVLFVGAATVAAIAVMGWLLARNVVTSTGLLLRRIQELASGASDLTARVALPVQDEIGQLADGINAMMGKIQAIVQRVRESSVQLLSAASQIAAGARQQETSMQSLGSSTTEIAAAVQEISATSKELASTMGAVNTQASQAAALATQGRTRLSEMHEAMQHLVAATGSIAGKLGLIREKAANINVVVTTITKVADQTNLLSINAAIEAEKAGEFGRGFLVVAREIRRLADQTAVATLDIENLVRLMHDAVSSGVMQMDKFNDEVRTGMARVDELSSDTSRIIEEVHGLRGRFEHVNEAMLQQSMGAQQINEAMHTVSATTRQQAAALDEFNKATSYLRASVEALNREIGQFKV
jgi:methyl-accepting chemotaxis protein WspA